MVLIRIINSGIQRFSQLGILTKYQHLTRITNWVPTGWFFDTNIDSYWYPCICLYTGPTLVYTVNFEVDIYSYLLLWPGWASSCSLDTSDGGASAGGRDSIPAAQASIRSEAIRPRDVSQEPGSHLPICTPLHWGERLLPCHSGIPHVSSIQTLPNSLASASRIDFFFEVVVVWSKVFF